MEVKEHFRGNQYRATQVCVDSYQDGVLVGRLYNPVSEEPRCFQSATQFLLQMEDLLDQLQFPQPFRAARSFGEPRRPAVQSAPAASAPAGKEATFVLKVFFRQNTSWQGSITWKEADLDQNFRSVLELLLLMDGALKSVFPQE